MVMKNPFVTNGYAGPEYFCDRVEETQHITEMLTNENNIALISPRRIGKTELIHHCFAQPVIQKDYYTFIIDIYSTNSVSDLVNMFGKAIIDELRPKGRSAWEKFLMALSSLRSEISFDTQTGAPLISNEISERREERAIRNFSQALLPLSLIHISEPTRQRT